MYQLWKERLETILHDLSGFGWGMDLLWYLYRDCYKTRMEARNHEFSDGINAGNKQQKCIPLLS